MSRSKQEENRQIQAVTIRAKRKTPAVVRIPAQFPGPEPPQFPAERASASVSLSESMPTTHPARRVADQAPESDNTRRDSRTISPLQELRKLIPAHTGILEQGRRLQLFTRMGAVLAS